MAFARTSTLSIWAKFALLAPLFAAGYGGAFAQPGVHTRDAATVPAAGDVPGARGDTIDPAARDARRSPGARLREGTELRELPGQFIQVDGRFEFVSSDGHHRLRLLENLALERATRKADETSRSVTWSVSGVVTEYHGANYLLVKRIVIKSADAHSAP